MKLYDYFRPSTASDAQHRQEWQDISAVTDEMAGDVICQVEPGWF